MLSDQSIRMAEIIRELRADSDDTETILRAISKTAVDSVPGTEYASVTLVTKGQIETPVVVGDIAGKSDDLQREFHEGPCVRSAVDDTTIIIDDMRHEQRWPRYADSAAELGIGSMACFCLYINGNDFGALNLISTTTHAFDGDAVAVGELFAAHCATAFSAVHEKEQLRAALSSRDVIGQAKGMVMERYRIDADAAFRLLARLSQDSNVKLVDIAHQIVEAGPE
ncbi:GAF and ANTAR domain-containing protein [Gordonia sp. ABSL11-1]|jgi:GAF domain-containing protein|uniref:GAF and ANTAR domain-containing protein n=1 Tax=Gordonia sp. ABSL11-1 TaxID=3053924 RepID=UPI0025741FDD|nr:GAF and ANTAR domain-containing protein [Gordonia sp. ABSL11-1]MDL9947361.1 GAF and ANTAR domain-containing protein [Gordonia sp. ABSL11-1]